MLHQFMKEKKPSKCDICDYSCSRKDQMKRHVASVHEEKKPNVTFVTTAFLERIK